MIDQFLGHKYISLETYRKDGTAIPTPVWFVQDQDKIYVRTIANSGKVKRIRNFPQVRVAPCDMRGGLQGSWTDAQASLVEGETGEYINQLLRKKYGMQKMFFDLMGSSSKNELLPC